MVENFDNNREKLRSFEDGMKEAAGLLFDSVWNDRVKPAVANLFSRQESHIAGQKAGTDALARLAKYDPESDAAYAEV